MARASVLLLSSLGVILILITAQCTEGQQCTGNTVLTNCGNKCKQSCETYYNPERICTLPCGIGCYCKPGYYYDDNGNCVLPKDCPKK
ncbi:hypothetical protein GDO81_014678 [Engystomops pustulosus]|uniref:TIL domain-containing protein n=1 Tax=Engystomops pustulosus TaxID=76066 RepID=A0AAV7BBV5_ENGPU|nr:hypothetical protein GDO81_014678 [Engystomops pustulosus]